VRKVRSGTSSNPRSRPTPASSTVVHGIVTGLAKLSRPGMSVSSGIMFRWASATRTAIKILWGRSGNRCALCRRVLVAERTPGDREAVVGDEAHIAARSAACSRYGECPPDMVDRYENLILLCRVDHKKIDDQPQHCTTARLRQAKAEHETWVEHALADVPAPIRVQFDSDDPVRLGLMKTGSDVRDAVQGAHRFVLGDLDEDAAATATSTARQRSCRAPRTGARSAAR
jgi:hypothetical protein